MGSDSLFIKCKKCGKMVSKSVNTCPECGAKIKKLSVVHWLGIVLLVLIIIGVINSPQKNNRNIIKEPKISIKDIVKENLKFDYSWTKEGFGSIMEADFFIKNKSIYDIKDIEILCIHFAKSGTKIDSNERKIYEVIKANSTKSYLNFNMGFIHEQANSSSCKINDFTLIK